MGPKESSKDREARERERRMSGLERDKATSETAQDLTSDLNSVYRRPSLFSMLK